MRNILTASVLLVYATSRLNAAPPDDFPRFQVPSHEHEMKSLRDLFWLHYPGAGPKATLWDEWLTDCSLWPAVNTGNQSEQFRQSWREVLSTRRIDPEGYVATHQHFSIAHQDGWPFPFWNQGRHGCGWHFSFKNTAPEGWRPHDLSKPNNWLLSGGMSNAVADDGWSVSVTNPNAVITAPPWKASTFEASFLQVRWQLSGLGDMQPFVEWTTPSATNFTPDHKMYFDPGKRDSMQYTMIPMYKHPQWTGEIAQLRIGLGNSTTGSVTLQAFFSQYDTRHNINGQDYVRGCAKYFWWTRDLNFLRANMNRMRTAIRYLMTEHHTQERKAIYMTWIGHDGRTGLKRSSDGKKEIVTGEGIGNNYWDLLPFGGLDCYATVQFYDALLVMARLEREVQEHSEWQIPDGPLSLSPAALEKHAAELKEQGNRIFWSADTGRFMACVDADNQTHDYGFTFLNCEAVYYDFATPEHARSIMEWVDGKRIVKDDTSQGVDIYHWRFAPRATTKRNLDWYYWAWNSPESIPWGGQVQDGGAVLAFSYHDLMSRLKVFGPDSAWARLNEILAWFDEVQAAGGYRKYYNGQREGSLQGAGTPGGLGMDAEFFESALVPQLVLKGFLGFSPRADGFSISPQLPRDWPSLSVDRIRFQDVNLTIQATVDSIKIERDGTATESLRIAPGKEWKSATLKRFDGTFIWPVDGPRTVQFSKETQ